MLNTYAAQSELIQQEAIHKCQMTFNNSSFEISRLAHQPSQTYKCQGQVNLRLIDPSAHEVAGYACQFYWNCWTSAVSISGICVWPAGADTAQMRMDTNSLNLTDVNFSSVFPAYYPVSKGNVGCKQNAPVFYTPSNNPHNAIKNAGQVGEFVAVVVEAFFW
jgi:hypothetical protein